MGCGNSKQAGQPAKPAAEPAAKAAPPAAEPAAAPAAAEAKFEPVTKEHVEKKYFEVFDQLDTDNSGTIDRKEAVYYSKLLIEAKQGVGADTTGAADGAETLFAFSDGDQNGTISKEEWLQFIEILYGPDPFMTKPQFDKFMEDTFGAATAEYVMEQYTKLFKELDKDGSGKLEKKEVLEYSKSLIKLRKGDVSGAEEGANTLFAISDADESGTVELEEWKQFVNILHGGDKVSRAAIDKFIADFRAQLSIAT